MPIIPKAPLIPLRIQPLELVILSVYLADRSRKETSRHLQGFVAYVAELVIEDALKRMFPKVRLEHEREQGEAFLQTLYRGFDPSDPANRNHKDRPDKTA
jgi:hypothetical protein